MNNSSASLPPATELGHPDEQPAEAAGTGSIPSWIAKLASPRFAIPLILALGAILYFANLGGYPFYTKGEPREAVEVYDIVHGGGFILPMRVGVEIPSKPPLMHWLAALFSVLAGHVNEWTTRMPSALLGTAGLVVCYLYVRELFGEVVALFASLILGTAIQYLQGANVARVDMTLTFFMEVAFFEFVMIAQGLTRRRMLLYLCLALAVLAKGPIGLALPALAALIWIALEHRWRLIAELNLFRGALIVLALAGSWYVAASIVGGEPFIVKQVLGENLFRLIPHAGFHEGHVHRFFYMEGALLAGFMPWSLVLPIVVVQALRHPRAMSPNLKYVIVWFATVLVFYNIPQSKRGIYLLSLYPALATLVAIYLVDAISHPGPARRWIAGLSKAAGAAFVIVGLAGTAGLVTLLAAPPVFADVLRWVARIDVPGILPELHLMLSRYWLAVLLISAAPIIVGLVMLRGEATADRLVFAITSGFVCVALAAKLLIVPAIAGSVSLKQFTLRSMKIVDGSPVAFLGSLNYEIAFYSGRRTIPVVSRLSAAPEFVFSEYEPHVPHPHPGRKRRFTPMAISPPSKLEGNRRFVLLKRVELSEPGSRPPGVPIADFASPISPCPLPTSRPARDWTSAPPPLIGVSARVPYCGRR